MKREIGFWLVVILSCLLAVAGVLAIVDAREQQLRPPAPPTNLRIVPTPPRK